VAGNVLAVQNTTDAASNQVAILRSGNRGTPADDDEGYLSLSNDDSNGAQQEFARLTWIAKDVTNTTKDAAFRLDLMLANTLTMGMLIDAENSIVAMGPGAGDSFTTGGDCVFIGKDAGTANDEGLRNVAIGTSAGKANTSGNDNFFVGFEAGMSNTTGNEGFFLGFRAGKANTSGVRDNFLGAFAGENNETGNDLTFIGYKAGNVNSAARECVFIGGWAGENSNANRNTFIGVLAGRANTTGAQGTFIGYNAAVNATTGAGHTIIGGLTAPTLIAGQFMTIVGHESDVSSSGITSSIILGYAATATANNQLVLGSANANGAITDAYIGSGVTKASPAAIALNATGGSGTDNSGADFDLAGGKGTGTAVGGSLALQVSPATGDSDADLNPLVDVVKIGASTTSTTLGFYNTAPVVQPTALTTQLTSITHTAPGTPDYALQDLVDSSAGAAFGFATKDEGNTLLSVVLNLQVRVQEVEDKMQALGLLA
jgi:hypothetical protein